MPDAPMPGRERPENAAMRMEQARVRKELGEKIAEQASRPMPVPEFEEPLIFRFKMWKNTQFSGLWRLEVLNRQGKVDGVICDADALPNVLEAIGNIFANRGL